MLRYPSVFRLDKLLADHARSAPYDMPLRPPTRREPAAKATGLYVHEPRGRSGRHTDEATERFVDATRMSAAQ
jgi:hypothetical protein